MANSREEALRLSHDYIGTEHILLGLIQEKETFAMRILKSLKLDLDELKSKLKILFLFEKEKRQIFK